MMTASTRTALATAFGLVGALAATPAVLADDVKPAVGEARPAHRMVIVNGPVEIVQDFATLPPGVTGKRPEKAEVTPATINGKPAHPFTMEIFNGPFVELVRFYVAGDAVKPAGNPLPPPKEKVPVPKEKDNPGDK